MALPTRHIERPHAFGAHFAERHRLDRVGGSGLGHGLGEKPFRAGVAKGGAERWKKCLRRSRSNSSTDWEVYRGTTQSSFCRQNGRSQFQSLPE
jgi:hypothetical protein